MISRRVFLATAMAASMTNKIKGIYIPGWQAINTRQLDVIKRKIDKTGVNTLLVDFKNAHGELFYASNHSSSQARTAEGAPRALNFKKLHELQKEGIKLFGRHVMFRDKYLYEHEPSLQLHRQRSEYWVDPRDERAIDYNLRLLEEEKNFGFDEVILDYIRFPGVRKFGSEDEKCVMIDSIVAQAREVFPVLGAQVFGWTAWDHYKAGVGQRMSTLAEHLDHIYPMIYPTHFYTGSFGFETPNEHPAYIYREGFRNASMKVSSAKIIPMLQSFWCSPEHMKAQLDTVEEEAMPGFLAWNARGNYELLEQARNLSSEQKNKEKH